MRYKWWSFSQVYNLQRLRKKDRANWHGRMWSGNRFWRHSNLKENIGLQLSSMWHRTMLSEITQENTCMGLHSHFTDTSLIYIYICMYSRPWTLINVIGCFGLLTAFRISRLDVPDARCSQVTGAPPSNQWGVSLRHLPLHSPACPSAPSAHVSSSASRALRSPPVMAIRSTHNNDLRLMRHT